MLRLIAFGLLTAAFIATPRVSFATIIQYTITVNVTSAPESPGDFLVNPWSFGPLPQDFVGTFDADDTVDLGISNLQLVIGGIDIALSHPDVGVNQFDPNTLTLVYGAFDDLLASFVGFNTTFMNTEPLGYVEAIENDTDSGPSPYSIGFDLNWSGTFSVVPSASSVPEPSVLAIFSMGAVGLIANAIRQRRRVK